jgi:hypothetical protein
LSGGGHRWFKRSTGNKRPVTRGDNDDNDDDNDNDDDDDNNNNNNKDLKEIIWLCMDCNDLAQDTDKWWTLETQK